METETTWCGYCEADTDSDDHTHRWCAACGYRRDLHDDR